MNNSASKHRPPRRRPVGGFALIEAMVGILIFAFGVLGLVGLQASMTKAQTAAKFRGEASYLASEVVGMMWGDMAMLNQYATTDDTTCSATRCADWARKVQSVLPGGKTEITVNDGRVTVAIKWTVPGEGQHLYTTSTVIHP